jgi:hypothetical protein
MATTCGSSGSSSRVGDGDVNLGEGWDWRSILQLISSGCLFFCSGWVPTPAPPFLSSLVFVFPSCASPVRFAPRETEPVGVGSSAWNRLLLAGARIQILWQIDVVGREAMQKGNGID